MRCIVGHSLSRREPLARKLLKSPPRPTISRRPAHDSDFFPRRSRSTRERSSSTRRPSAPMIRRRRGSSTTWPVWRMHGATTRSPNHCTGGPSRPANGMWAQPTSIRPSHLATSRATPGPVVIWRLPSVCIAGRWRSGSTWRGPRIRSRPLRLPDWPPPCGIAGSLPLPTRLRPPPLRSDTKRSACETCPLRRHWKL